DADDGVRLGRPEHAGVLLAEADRIELLLPGPQPRQLRLGRRHEERAALAEAAVDALALDGFADVVDRRVGLAIRPQDRVVAGLPLVRVGAPDQAARHPAAVSARRPEAGDLAFADDDAHVGLGAGQVVGGPQSREPGA